MSIKGDYYEILGLSKGASVDEIKKSYRQLVMKHHPDRVSGDKKKEAEERFKEISEAYAVLSDPGKKKLYDQYGHAGIDSRYSTEDILRGADFSSIFGGRGGFGDIFEQIFGGSDFDIFGGGASNQGSHRRRVGEDIQLQVEISLEEVSTGIEKNVSYARYDNCSACHGSGAEPGSSKVNCPTCKGSGAIRSGMGFISFSQACPACGGEGQIIKNSCKRCSGEGRVRSKKNLRISIPKGVDVGSVLRLKGEGCSAGAGRGDLYVYIQVRSHSLFFREVDNIRCKVKLSVIKAIVGAEIDVPTLYGNVRMKVPAGTQPNTIFRLKSKGIANLRTGRLGDELVEIEIDIPRRLSTKERRIIGEWAKLRREEI